MKTWLITGCSSGLGKSLAKTVLERGDQAVVTARSPETLRYFEERFPDTALIAALDVTDQAAIERTAAVALERFGSIDMLVNNAGYGYRAAVEEGDPEDTDRLFQTHFWGPILHCRAAHIARFRLLRRGEARGRRDVGGPAGGAGAPWHQGDGGPARSLPHGVRREVPHPVQACHRRL